MSFFKGRIFLGSLGFASAFIISVTLTSCGKKEGGGEVISKRVKIEVKEETAQISPSTELTAGIEPTHAEGQRPPLEAKAQDHAAPVQAPAPVPAPAAAAPKAEAPRKDEHAPAEPKKEVKKAVSAKKEKKAEEEHKQARVEKAAAANGKNGKAEKEEAKVKKASVEKATKEKAQKADNNKEARKTGVKKDKAAVAAAKPWAINVASFSNMREAQEIAGALKKAGYNAYITEFTKDEVNWFRVRVGFYRTQDEAKAASRAIVKNYKVQSSWIVKPQRSETAEHVE